MKNDGNGDGKRFMINRNAILFFLMYFKINYVRALIGHSRLVGGRQEIGQSRRPAQRGVLAHQLQVAFQQPTFQSLQTRPIPHMIQVGIDFNARLTNSCCFSKFLATIVFTGEKISFIKPQFT